MICTEQERDALMAAIRQYGDTKSDEGWGQARDDLLLADSSRLVAESDIDRIRAMLAPPDDAVLRERELRLEAVARAAYADWVVSKWDCGSDELRAAIHACVDADDFAVLRGEAIR